MIKLPLNPYAGSFSDFKKDFPGEPEWKWWHGQMRGWAWYWRNAKLLAALLGQSPSELAETYLALAKNYRATFRQLRGAA